MKKTTSLPTLSHCCPTLKSVEGEVMFSTVSIRAFYLWFVIYGGPGDASKGSKINGWEDQFHISSTANKIYF